MSEFGIKSRYWDVYRRLESERQREKHHVTKFGPHWVVEHVKRPAGARDYSTDGSPYQPRMGYAGIWKGRTASTGKAAPNRWAKQGYGPLPYGLGELQIQMILRRWAIDTVNTLRLSNDRWSYQRLRDVRRHVFEQNELQPLHDQELASVELTVGYRTDELRWLLDFSNAAVADRPVGPYDSYVAAANGMRLENITRTIEERRAGFSRHSITGEIESKKFKPKPVRERQKAGRKPLGPVAQTSAERARRYRRNKALRSKPHERHEVGTDQQPSLPRLSSVSTDPFTNARGGDTK
jgi:hypothetical protein